jgi:hypothetical protein
MSIALVKGMAHRRCITAAFSNNRNNECRRFGHLYHRNQALIPYVSNLHSWCDMMGGEFMVTILPPQVRRVQYFRKIM